MINSFGPFDQSLTTRLRQYYGALLKMFLCYYKIEAGHRRFLKKYLRRERYNVKDQRKPTK